MSWLQTNDLAVNDTQELEFLLNIVRKVENAFEIRGLIFYKANETWYIDDPYYEPFGDDWLINLERWVISLTEPETRDKVMSKWTVLKERPTLDMKLTGETGVAEKVQLNADAVLQPGNTVLVGGTDVLIVDEGTTARQVAAVYGVDAEPAFLLVPPWILRSAAIAVGNRLAKLELDEDIDDMPNGDLFDGYTIEKGYYT